jgi:hypothetical protein
MNYWWDTHVYQQSNKISALSATDCTLSASVMIISTSTTVSPVPTATDPDSAWRAGRLPNDTLVVIKLDRLARSLPAAPDM